MGKYGQISSTTRLVDSNQHTSLENKLDHSRARIPGPSHTVSQKDLYSIAGQLTCLALAVVTVFFQRLASYLGQLNQLIVIGFLLGLMALINQSQVLRTLMVLHGGRWVTTLQDIDATLRQDLFAPRVSIWLRGLLLGLIALPLGLSVSYKLFVGGSSSRTLHLPDGMFGYAASPGNQRIGDGLTLLADLYRPFWIDPSLNRTYGSNLFIQDNATAVIVDAPYPSYLTYLQSRLSERESLTLAATVNATIARETAITTKQRSSSDYWSDILSVFGHEPTFNGGGTSGSKNALLAGMGANIRSNFSIAYFSIWNTTRNETFESEAIRIDNYRALYHATWNVTNTNASLVDAAPAEDVSHWWQSAANQSIIQYDFLGVQEMFSNFLGEYDWHNRAGDFQFPYPDASSIASTNDATTCPRDVAKCKWDIGSNTVPALSAAMIWARMTSLNGGDRPIRDPDRLLHTMYSKSADDVVTIKYIPTLRRTLPLLLVLVTNPVITVLCVVVKLLWLGSSRVGDGFNAVALLAAGMGEDWSVLAGAQRSGSLERKVGLRFVGEGDDEAKIRLV